MDLSDLSAEEIIEPIFTLPPYSSAQTITTCISLDELSTTSNDACIFEDLLSYLTTDESDFCANPILVEFDSTTSSELKVDDDEDIFRTMIDKYTHL